MGTNWQSGRLFFYPELHLEIGLFCVSLLLSAAEGQQLTRPNCSVAAGASGEA